MLLKLQQISDDMKEKLNEIEGIRAQLKVNPLPPPPLVPPPNFPPPLPFHLFVSPHRFSSCRRWSMKKLR
eukprot:754143-Hanusia_phi.AAC.2